MEQNTHVRQISLQQILDINIDMLENIPAPVKFEETISKPVKMVIENLKVAINFADQLMAKLQEVTEKQTLADDEAAELEEVDKNPPEGAEIVELGEYREEAPASDEN